MNIILIIILITILLILAWAVFSNKPEPAIAVKPAPEKEQNDEPEKILRRRSADRAIEKEFPAEKAGSDISGENLYERDDSTGQIQLPFPANDIIADGSRFKLYKRALINSEIYAKRGDIETAVSLFKGVKERILDSDIRSKIESNINYLNHFRHRRDEDFKKKVDSATTGQQQTSGELRLRIDGPVPQTINIGMPEKSFINTDEIIEKLSGQIARELGTLKSDIEILKTKPDDKFDLDDYAEFSNLQHEFNNLKERFEELTEERLNTLKELNKLREMKEEEIEKVKVKDHSPENHEILKDIRKEIDNLSGLKHSLDSLHNKIEDISSFQIPESKNQPSIIQAKYESPIPIHFDPKPVLELLDKINQQRKEDKAEGSLQRVTIPEEKAPDQVIHEEILEHVEIFKHIEEPAEEIIKAETAPEDFTYEELDEIHEEVSAEETDQLQNDDLFPADEVPVIAESGPDDETEMHEAVEDFSLDDLTTLEAEEFINEITDETPEEIVQEEALFEEPEIRYEEPVEEIVKDEDLTAELSDDEIEIFSRDKVSEPEAEKPAAEIKKDEPPAEEILKTEKEKEIEKHTDAEEDANDFDLVSEIGKVKDDSTLTDEDIFEKILKDDKNKGDDSAFEIIGDIHRDEQEFALNDSVLDGKQKAEQDFYKKFIKADRIKKRELPILKVSYDFKKLPDEFSLSREKNILEYSFYKYKPMLQKADEFIKHRHVRDAINYYRVVLDQNIPIEFKAMIKRNIRDLTDYLEKYLSSE